MVLFQLPVNVAEPFQGHRRYLGQKEAIKAQTPAVADGPADNPAQHVAASLITGHNSVANQERGGPGVFGHYPKGIVRFPVNTVGLATQFNRLLNNRPEYVGLVNVGFVLEDRGRPLQTHTGVHAWGGQRRSVALGILVILHKDQVPQLDKPLAVTVGMTAGRILTYAGFPLSLELSG